MAAGPLGLHPALRPWYAAGLRYVYLDDEALAQLAEEREGLLVKTQSPVTPSMRHAGQASGQASDQTSGQVQSWQDGQAQRRRERREQERQTEVQQNPEVSQTSSPRPEIQGPQATTIPPEHWPRAWQERLESTLNTAKRAPVLWTYWALGEDLGGAPNAPRRDILRRILGELNLPRGTHCFWPIALPDGDVPVVQHSNISPEAMQSTAMHLEANAPIYLAGLQILAPRVCIVMGSKALRTIMPHSTTGPFQQTQYGRMLFFVLPDMDILLKEPERIPRVVAYLRMALQPFMGRR